MLISMDIGAWWATVQEAAESDMTKHTRTINTLKQCIDVWD